MPCPLSTTKAPPKPTNPDFEKRLGWKCQETPTNAIRIQEGSDQQTISALILYDRATQLSVWGSLGRGQQKKHSIVIIDT